jgi:phosphoglycerate dehydrogenase-like enzyme
VGSGRYPISGYRCLRVVTQPRFYSSVTWRLVTRTRELGLVVVAAPLTPQTEHLVDAAALAAMPDGALLINAGRGRIVDTDALAAELRTGRIRAGLDVVEPEPLPADHPLWTCPGVVISPHSARTVPGQERLCYEVAAQQIGQLLAGETPSNARRSTAPAHRTRARQSPPDLRVWGALAVWIRR